MIVYYVILIISDKKICQEIFFMFFLYIYIHISKKKLSKSSIKLYIKKNKFWIKKYFLKN